MNLDAEWTQAALKVIQATNVVLIHSPEEPICRSVRDLTISAHDTHLALTREVAIANLESEEQRIDPYQFIWSILRMHNASFCPLCRCELCLQRIKKTEWATCLALVRTLADVPASLKATIEVGACWVFIHDHEVPIIPAQNTLGCLSQQSSITPNLLVTTLASQSRVDLDTLHELNQKRASELFIRSKMGVC